MSFIGEEGLKVESSWKLEHFILHKQYRARELGIMGEDEEKGEFSSALCLFNVIKLCMEFGVESVSVSLSLSIETLSSFAHC